MSESFQPGEVGPQLSAEDQSALNALIESGELVPASADILFRKTDYEFMIEKIRNELLLKGTITLGQVRDLFNTSRKYAQALLEHLDSAGITMREGDFRKLRRR